MVKQDGEIGVVWGAEGEPYVPRTPEAKEQWAEHIKHALGAFLYLAEQADLSQDEVDQAVAMLGFEDLYRLSLGP